MPVPSKSACVLITEIMAVLSERAIQLQWVYEFPVPCGRTPLCTLSLLQRKHDNCTEWLFQLELHKASQTVSLLERKVELWGVSRALNVF